MPPNAGDNPSTRQFACEMNQLENFSLDNLEAFNRLRVDKYMVSNADRYMAEHAEEIRVRAVTKGASIATDGWSSRMNKGFIGICWNVMNLAYFPPLVACGARSTAAEYEKKLKPGMQSILPMVFFACTDGGNLFYFIKIKVLTRQTASNPNP
jgi:hypothetical protein